MRLCKKGHIYCIYCLPTGKSYFGQTVKSIEKRYKQHLRAAQRGENTKLCKAIRKYGSKNFTIEGVISVEASSLQALKAKLDFLERHFIQKYDTRRNGYNMTDGGDGSVGDGHPMFGKHHSIESRMKIASKLRGKTLSEEHRMRISKTERGKLCLKTRKERFLRLERNRFHQCWGNGFQMNIAGNFQKRIGGRQYEIFLSR